MSPLPPDRPRTWWWPCLFLVLQASLPAERFPVRNYTTADGLPANHVNRVMQDSRGFLWLATDDGLSRFDGYQFSNSGVERGLPHRMVNDLLETRDGQFWVATGGGVVRFNPRANSSEPRFIPYGPGGEDRLRWTNALLEDRSGAIWCGTRGGLYRIDASAGRPGLNKVEIGLPNDDPRQSEVEALLEDRHGVLWVPAGNTVYRRLPDGRTERYNIPNPKPGYNRVHALTEDRAGHIWAATELGLYRFASDPRPSEPLVERAYDLHDGLPGWRLNAVLTASDGSIWVASGFGLAQLRITDRGEVSTIRKYGQAEGLAYVGIEHLAEDRDGNLWAGTYDGGLMRINRGEFAAYDAADGLDDLRVVSVFEDLAGDLLAVGDATRGALHVFDGTRFHRVAFGSQRTVPYFGWGTQQITLQDHTGEWWTPTGEALLRYPKVDRIEQLARVRPKRVYTTRDGLGGNDIFRLFEDSRGDIWIATVSSGSSGVTRWDRSTDTFQRYSQADGLPSSTPAGTPTAFSEDGDGDVWFGFYNGGLGRYRGGKFRLWTAADGAPRGGVRALYLDHARRLWAATGDGLTRVDDPASQNPRFAPYSRGLSSSDIRLLTEDRWGWLVACSSRGIDRLNVEDGSAHHYTVNDAGLAIGSPHCAFRDRRGTVWIGTHSGLVRFQPRADPPAPLPRVLITGLEVSGMPRRVSELGEAETAHFTLDPDQNQVQIEFVEPGFGSVADFGYQYMLEGEDRGWSYSTPQRTVHYAGLRPGNHRFLVRTVTAAGAASPQPAIVSFTILRPVWQRAWFVTLAILAFLSLLYAAHRRHLARLLELERVRTRIATDLHDDIGASLSQIVVLSEVIAQQPDGPLREVAEPLSRIAAVSRDLVDSMSDIVWAVNPRKDHLSDVVQRMRRFAGDLFASRDIELRFRVAGGAGERRLGADVRREVFLIFKESVHNIVRHSACTEVEIDFEVAGDWLTLRLADNGKGFDPAEDAPGTGLINMRERARRLGGELAIASGAGQGSVSTMKIPLASRKKWLRK